MSDCVVPNCPHHFHNHPTVRLRGHDQIREQVSAALIGVQAQIMAIAVQHHGHLDDLLDALPLLGKFLDAMRWESLDMIAYLHSQGMSQQEAMRMCAESAGTRYRSWCAADGHHD
jgi:type II secretory pathway component PulF